MSGTTIFYNGVLLQDCETLDYQQVIEYEKEGRKDAMFSRYRITVASNLVSVYSDNVEASVQHPSTVLVRLEAGDNNPDTDQLAVDRLSIVESKLQEPRKDFWMAVQSDFPATNPTTHELKNSRYRIVLAATGEYDHFVLLPPPAVNPPSSYPEFIRSYGNNQFTNAKRVEHIDADDGPQTSNVSVKFVGFNFMRVTVTFDVCVNLCRGDDTRPYAPVRDARKVQGVIANRWSVTESLDGNMRTTHTINGKLRVKDHRYKAQAMRTMVHPLLFPYAKLESRTFAVDPIGHELTYSFTIREVGDAPPPGIVDWSGEYTESTGAGGGNMFGSINLEVTGPIKLPPGMTRQQQKTLMLRVLYAMLRARITGINTQWDPLPGQEANNVLLVDAMVSENMKEPKMSLRARVRYASQLNTFGLRLANMGSPIPIAGHNRRWWPIPDYWMWQYNEAPSNGTSGDAEWGTTWDGENQQPEGKDGGGSYFEPYSQGPCDLWHSLPRMAKVDKIKLAEPIPPAGDANDLGHGTNANGTVKQDKAIPGYFDQPFVAYNAPHIAGDADLVPVTSIPSIDPATRFGVDPEQWNGFTYLHWDSHVSYSKETGMRQFPLSAPRLDPGAASGLPTEKKQQTAVCVRLHHPLPKREITITAKRRGDWPKMPDLAESYRDKDGQVETLLDSKVATVTPYLDKDNVSLIYELQVSATYGLTADPTRRIATSEPGQYTLKSLSSPMDRTSPDDNRVSIWRIFDQTSAIDKYT